MIEKLSSVHLLSSDCLWQIDAVCFGNMLWREVSNHVVKVECEQLDVDFDA